MRKTIVTLALIAPAMIPATILGMATPAQATKPAPEHKVTICHATASETNPYVQITVDIASSGYLKAGHSSHEGDIIPPYTYEDFSFAGQGDQSILANGCEVPGEPTETPPPTTPPPTEPPPTNPPPTEPPTTKPPANPPKGFCAGNGATRDRCNGGASEVGGAGKRVQDDLAYTGLSGGQMVLAGVMAVLFIVGGALVWLKRRRFA